MVTLLIPARVKAKVDRVRKNGEANFHACAQTQRANGSASGGGKLSTGVTLPNHIRTLFEALTNDDIIRVAEVYREAMHAERQFWVDQGRSKTGHALGYWQKEPDHKTRIAAANMVAAYRDGLPIARQLALQGTFEELGILLESMRSSGEAARLLGAMPANAREVSSVPCHELP